MLDQDCLPKANHTHRPTSWSFRPFYTCSVVLTLAGFYPDELHVWTNLSVFLTKNLACWLPIMNSSWASCMNIAGEPLEQREGSGWAHWRLPRGWRGVIFTPWQQLGCHPAGQMKQAKLLAAWADAKIGPTDPRNCGIWDMCEQRANP